MVTFNETFFKAKLFHGLKSLLSTGDTLPPRFLEIAICDAFGFTHVGDSTFYADGVAGQLQMSIKTRMINPTVLKTKKGRDFQSCPGKFLGPRHNVKQDTWAAGVEIVQRRQQVNFENDRTESPSKVGQATLVGFNENITESYNKFKTSQSLEVIVAHGYDFTGGSYMASVFWQLYQPLNVASIIWSRDISGVIGNLSVDGVQMKVCSRVNGNAKREATCFKEYKDLTKYDCSAHIRLPLPEQWKFDQTSILAEIYLKEQAHNVDSILFAK